MKSYQIEDIYGDICFNGKTFKTFNEALEFLSNNKLMRHYFIKEVSK